MSQLSGVVCIMSAPLSSRMTAWMSIGSTYTYLTAMRMRERLGAARLRESEVNMVPFSVRAVMVAQKNVPFVGKDAKMKYMWRDIERRAARYGVPVPRAVPVPGYPLAAFDEANLVGVAANEHGVYWGYLEHAYNLWFLHGKPPGDAASIRAALSAIDGVDVDAVIEASRSEEILQKYESNTAAALSLGVFGAPSFTVGDELFWGDDRLDDAIDEATWSSRE